MLRPLLLLVVLLAPAAAAKSAAPFEMEAQMTEKYAKPQTVVVFPVTFTSRSTENVKLFFEVVRADERFIAPVLMPGVLQPAGSPAHTADVPFIVQTPYWNGYVNETGTVTYRITPKHPDTGATLANPEELSVTVHARGFYVRGPQMFGVFIALALAAFLARRTRA